MMDNLYYIGINITKAKFDLAFVENSQKFYPVFDYLHKRFSDLNKFLEKRLKNTFYNGNYQYISNV